MKISFWKALGMVGLLADELTKAGVDGKVSFDEGLVIAKNLASTAGLTFDDKGTTLVLTTVTDLMNAAADGKITIVEMVVITEKLCAELGIEFDKTGFNV
jgi:hypothetical protein